MRLQASLKQHLAWLHAQWQQAGTGMPLRLYTLQNTQACVTITNYGLRIVHLFVPDKNEKPTDVIVGPELPAGFLLAGNPYYGAIIGRFANRIANGRFSLQEQGYQLACNNGTNHLHGGVQGFHNQVWNCLQQSDAELVFVHHSPDGAEGYPGNLEVKVRFQLKGSRLSIQYSATTDAPTILNLTHHPFFNLNGCGATNIEAHQLQLECEQYLPVNDQMIPEGMLSSVAETPFDFRKAASMHQRLQQQHIQLQRGAGFDHTFVRNNYASEVMGLIATVWSDTTGIGMRISTTEPGVQLYTGNFMDGTNATKNGAVDGYRSAFCLETQHFPDSPNQPQFPSVQLLPGELFTSITHFDFFITSQPQLP